MLPRVNNRSWTQADIIRLRELSEKGAPVVRAAAALNRTTAAVKKVARLHGIRLAGTRQLMAAIRAFDPDAGFSANRLRHALQQRCLPETSIQRSIWNDFASCYETVDEEMACPAGLPGERD